jgi:hypothetical protein
LTPSMPRRPVGWWRTWAGNKAAGWRVGGLLRARATYLLPCCISKDSVRCLICSVPPERIDRPVLDYARRGVSVSSCSHVSCMRAALLQKQKQKLQPCGQHTPQRDIRTARYSSLSSHTSQTESTHRKQTRNTCTAYIEQRTTRLLFIYI